MSLLNEKDSGSSCPISVTKIKQEKRCKKEKRKEGRKKEEEEEEKKREAISTLNQSKPVFGI
jgi:hypothetical protein